MQYIQQVVTREKDVEGLNFSYLVFFFFMAYSGSCHANMYIQFNLYHNIRLLDPRTLSLSLAHSAKDSARIQANGVDPSRPLVKCT